jgi:hypothetical protein
VLTCHHLLTVPSREVPPARRRGIAAEQDGPDTRLLCSPAAPRGRSRQRCRWDREGNLRIGVVEANSGHRLCRVDLHVHRPRPRQLHSMHRFGLIDQFADSQHTAGDFELTVEGELSQRDAGVGLSRIDADKHAPCRAGPIRRTTSCTGRSNDECPHIQPPRRRPSRHRGGHSCRDPRASRSPRRE